MLDDEAEALFTQFAERHGLSYDMETGVPMEVCWSFPAQEKSYERIDGT